MTFKKDLEGRIEGLVEEMKEKERQKITPRLLARVAGRMSVPLFTIEDLGERDTVYCRKEATGPRSLIKGLRPDSDYLFSVPYINI